MNFGFSEEQELLRKTARDFLADRATSKRVREIMEGPATRDDALWQAMAELGWLGLALPEAHGGAGLTWVELCILAEELGRVLAPVPFLPTAMAACAVQELGSAEQQAAWLPGIASGATPATLALTEEHGREAPGDLAFSARRDGDGWRLSGSKLFVPDAADAGLTVVVARTGGSGSDGLAAFAVPGDAAGLATERLGSMDLLRPVYRLECRDLRLPAESLLGGRDDAWPEISRVLDRARVLVAAEMVGAAEKCLEDSVAYAKERVQFGKPIGVHQAIKHKCADMLFQVESSRSITYYAAWAACQSPDEAALTAAMAKAFTSDAFRHVAAENIQIHGGVGFTWEYDCHLYFKRAKSDEVWLGDGTSQRERVADLLPV